MPTIGDEIRGKEIGKVGSRNKEMQVHVWVRCPHCLNERWVQKKSAINPVNNKSRLCPSCAKNNAKQFCINPEKAAKEGRI
jgi:hypothetical protein